MLKMGTVKEVREIVKLKQETIEEREFIYNRIFSSKDLGRWIVKKIGSDSQENVMLIGLNTRMQINVISINLLDHIIVNDRDYFSFAENEYL